MTADLHAMMMAASSAPNWAVWDGSLNGSAVTVDTRCDYLEVAALSDTKFVAQWYTGSVVKAAVCTVTDTSISVGTPVTVVNTTIGTPSGRGCKLCLLDAASAKVLCSYQTASGTMAGRVLTADLSGNTITVGAEQDSGTNPGLLGPGRALSGAKAIFSSSSSNGYWVWSISGDAITFTNAISNGVHDSNNYKVAINSSYMLIAEKNNTTGQTRLVNYSVSGTTMTAYSTVVLEAGGAFYPAGVVLLDSGYAFSQNVASGVVYGRRVGIDGSLVLSDGGGNSGETEMAGFQAMNSTQVIGFAPYATSDITARVLSVPSNTVTQGSAVTIATAQSAQTFTSAYLDNARCVAGWQAGASGPGKVMVLKAA